ncbi:elongation of very long chain fatty acids protein 4, partial [Nilaparvata lugens]|uniref:elongation of very long chain fatty acids protein 4 n=1 Tax=Nilaparvata lugens TaxID=108931 RepID=UPI00193D9B26
MDAVPVLNDVTEGRISNLINNSTRTMTEYLFEYYEWAQSLSDKRTKGWLLVDSPLPTLLCVLFYLIAVRIGPVFMRNRRPMKLKWILIPYNLLMTLLNLYIVIQLLIGSIRLGYNYLCQAIGQIDHKEELRIANAVWWYYFSKLLEFFGLRD